MVQAVDNIAAVLLGNMLSDARTLSHRYLLHNLTKALYFLNLELG